MNLSQERSRIPGLDLEYNPLGKRALQFHEDEPCRPIEPCEFRVVPRIVDCYPNEVGECRRDSRPWQNATGPDQDAAWLKLDILIVKVSQESVGELLSWMYLHLPARIPPHRPQIPRRRPFCGKPHHLLLVAPPRSHTPPGNAYQPPVPTTAETIATPTGTMQLPTARTRPPHTGPNSIEAARKRGFWLCWRSVWGHVTRIPRAA